MSPTAVLTSRSSSFRPNLPPSSQFHRRNRRLCCCHSYHSSSLHIPCNVISPNSKLSHLPTLLFNHSPFWVKCLKQTDGTEDGEYVDISERQDEVAEDIVGGQETTTPSTRSSFLAKLAIGLGIAATITLLSIGLKQTNQEYSYGIQFLSDGASSSTFPTPNAGFTFKAFGYRVVLPEYAPGWIYFWMLMAAGCGLFISEEALNIWVGISLARLLSLDGTWQSFIESFSRNAPYILSTVLWVYWGVCISDMVPFYLGRFFRKSGASDDVCLKLGVGKDKAIALTRLVKRYGNLIGFVERFSLGVRNPTAFLAGALFLLQSVTIAMSFWTECGLNSCITSDISPECFFAGVCCGGLITLPIQLGIGFLLRERPVFALATVATVVGVWTLFPYAVAASTALFFYLRQRYSI